MVREYYYTLAIYAILGLLALTSWPGLCLAGGWIAVGLWFVFKTSSRGLLADASFVATWPLYVILGR